MNCNRHTDIETTQCLHCLVETLYKKIATLESKNLETDTPTLSMTKELAIADRLYSEFKMRPNVDIIQRHVDTLLARGFTEQDVIAKAHRGIGAVVWEWADAMFPPDLGPSYDEDYWATALGGE